MTNYFLFVNATFDLLSGIVIIIFSNTSSSNLGFFAYKHINIRGLFIAKAILVKEQ